MSTDLPGIGVFGTGTSTYTLIPFLRNVGYHVEAIWGRRREEAEKAATDLGIPFFTNRIDDVLLRKGVDLLLILCPPYHHSQIAVKALGIGKHVCVQSPGGLNQNETLRMVQAAQYYPSLNSVLIHGLRFVPAFARMKHEIRKGYTGSEISLCDVRINMGSLINPKGHYSWSCDDVMGGGILNQFGSHIIDILHYVTGQKAVRVYGTVRTFARTIDNNKVTGIRQISSDDLATFQLEMSGGTFATVTLNSHLIQGFDQEIIVSGPDGYLAARNGSLFGRRKEGEETEEEEVLELDDSEEDKKNLNSSYLLPQMYLRGIVRMFEFLVRKFEEEEENGDEGKRRNDLLKLSNFEDALYVQAVIEAIKLSSKEKTWIKVSYGSTT